MILRDFSWLAFQFLFTFFNIFFPCDNLYPFLGGGRNRDEDGFAGPDGISEFASDMEHPDIPDELEDVELEAVLPALRNLPLDDGDIPDGIVQAGELLAAPGAADAVNDVAMADEDTDDVHILFDRVFGGNFSFFKVGTINT